MVSFKYLIFIALVVYTVTAEDGDRVKKHAYNTGVHTPVWSHPAVYPARHSYSTRHGYKYPTVSYQTRTYPKHFTYHTSYATYPTSIMSHGSYRSYNHDNGQHWPAKHRSGKYEMTYVPTYKAAYPMSYRHY